MTDNKTTLQDIKNRVCSFTREREWEQFYNAKSISMAIAVEAAELMDIFVWTQDKQEIDERCKQKRVAVEHEIADILFALLILHSSIILTLRKLLLLS